MTDDWLSYLGNVKMYTENWISKQNNSKETN